MKTIFMLSGIPYDHLRHRPQHFSLFFYRKGFNVVFININDFNKISQELLERANDQHSFISELFSKNDEGIWLLKDIQVSDYNMNNFSLLIEKAANYFGESSIFLVLFPTWMDYLEKVGEKTLLIYDCMDDWELFVRQGILKKSEEFFHQEKKLASIADLVLASSNRLYLKMANLNENVMYLPNGVWNTDYALIPEDKYPIDLTGIMEPIVFFMGAIAEWVDINLIEFLARSRPDYSFVFVGHERVKLPIAKNIYFLGEKKYEELPRYLNYSNIAIVPFKVNSLTAAVTPLKLFEYISAGKPVVSTIMPDLLNLRGIRIAKNYSEFLFYLDELISFDQHRLQQLSLEATTTAELFDWNHLLEPLLNYINETQCKNISTKEFLTSISTTYQKYTSEGIIVNELIEIYNYLGKYDKTAHLYKELMNNYSGMELPSIALAYAKLGYLDKAENLLYKYCDTENKILERKYINSLLSDENGMVFLEVYLLKLSGNIYGAFKIMNNNNLTGMKALGLMSGLYLEIYEYEVALEIIINNGLITMEKIEEYLEINTLYFLIKYLTEKNSYELAEEIALYLYTLDDDWKKVATELLADIYISNNLPINN